MDAPSYGELLVARRDERQVSAYSVARRAGISTTYLRMIERGLRSVPSGDVRARVYDALELSPEKRVELEEAAQMSRCPTCGSLLVGKP